MLFLLIKWPFLAILGRSTFACVRYETQYLVASLQSALWAISNKFFFVFKLFWSTFGDMSTDYMAGRTFNAFPIYGYFFCTTRFDGGRLAFIFSINILNLKELLGFWGFGVLGFCPKTPKPQERLLDEFENRFLSIIYLSVILIEELWRRSTLSK